MKKLILRSLSLLFAIAGAFCSASIHNTVRAQKLELAVMTLHSSRVESVALSPNGQLMASTGGNLILWNAVTGRFIKQLGGEVRQRFVVFSPDSKTLASCNDDQLILWNIETGAQLRNWKSVFYGDNRIAFSPDGKLLATTNSAAVTIWGRDNGEMNRFTAHASNLSVAFSPDGKVLVTSGIDKEAPIKIWDVKTWKLLRSLKGQQEGEDVTSVWSVEFSPDGTILASSGPIDGVKLWAWENGTELRALRADVRFNPAIAFSPNGKILATTGHNQIQLWDVSTGQETQTLGEKDPEGLVFSLKFSGDGKTLLSSRSNSSTTFWDIATRKPVHTIVSRAITSVIPSLDGQTLTVGLGDQTKLLNLANLHTLKSFPTTNRLGGPGQEVPAVSFSRDGKVLATAGADNTIKLFDVLTGTEIKTLKGHTNQVTALSFAADGKTLASGGRDGTIKLWELSTQMEIKSLKQVSPLGEGANLVTSLAFSSDGKLLASGSRGWFQICDLRSDDPPRGGVIIHLEPPMVRFSPDDKRLVIINTPEAIIVYDIAKGYRDTYREASLPDSLRSSTFTYVIEINGRTIRIVPEGSMMKMIDLADNQEIARVVLVDESEWVVLAPDGRFDSSEGAQNSMHYTYGLEIINFEQLKEMYYEPGLLQKLLGFSKEPLRPIVALKDVKLHPEIVDQSIKPNSTALTVKLKNRGGGIGPTQILVNGSLAVGDARDAKLKAHPDVALNGIVTLTVDLKGSKFIRGKENKVTVVTSNYLKQIGKGNIQGRGAEIVWKPAGKEAEFQLPTLYAIVGGVSDYAGEQLDLRFAAKDAEDFSHALQLGGRRLFCASENPNCLDKVNITTLSTSGREGTILPNKENFKKAFADIASKARPEDILLVYLAGHGVSLGTGTDTYFYLTQEARTTSREGLAKVLTTSTISSEELTEWLTLKEWIPGQKGIRALKQVLILDTCASGSAAEKLALSAKRELSGDQVRAIEFLKDKTGTFVLMGSTADAPSYEASQFGQGLLTYSLLQAMKGAALDKGEFIDVQTLFGYAQTQVPRLAANIGGVQRPIVSAPLGKSFLIGQMTDADKVRLILPAPKTLLLRPLLTNPETGDDDLKLIPELRKRLDAESSYEAMRRSGKGEPVLFYIDDDSFPGAVRVTGTYTVEGGKLRVKAFLRRDGQTIATLPEIFASRERVLDELVSAIRTELSRIDVN